MLVVTTAVSAGAAPRAAATFPGRDGVIAIATQPTFIDEPTVPLPIEPSPLFLVRPDSTVVSQPSFPADNMSWSPDGRWMLYLRRLGGAPEANTLWIARADGSGARVVARAPAAEGFGLLTPSWSPNGRFIVYEVIHNLISRRLFGRLVRVRADGSGRRVIRGEHVAVEHLAWSPNGRLIALLVPGTGRLEAIRPDGGGLQVLARGVDAISLDFSPDGKRVAFIEHPNDVGHRAVQILTLRTGRRRTIGRANARVTPFVVVWSPSGRRLAVLEAFRRTGRSRVVTVMPDGRDRRIVFRVPSSLLAESLSWQSLPRTPAD